MAASIGQGDLTKSPETYELPFPNRCVFCSEYRRNTELMKHKVCEALTCDECVNTYCNYYDQELDLDCTKCPGCSKVDLKSSFTLLDQSTTKKPESDPFSPKIRPGSQSLNLSKSPSHSNGLNSPDNMAVIMTHESNEGQSTEQQNLRRVLQEYDVHVSKEPPTDKDLLKEFQREKNRLRSLINYIEGIALI